jgi:TetR/AcrR family transcriptional regulator, transcriptional repressor of bet genes
MVNHILTNFGHIAVMPKIVDPIAQRKMITDAAIRVIDAQGIEGAKLRDVARAANVTTGTIMHYFVSKQEMLASVLAEIAARTIERIQTANVASDAFTIHTFINEAIYQLPTNDEKLSEWRVWLAFCGAAIADPELKAIHRRHYRKIVSRAMVLLGRLRAAVTADREQPPTRRFSFDESKVSVLAIPERISPGRAAAPAYPRQVHRCAEALVAAIEGIGSRAALDPDRWPLWCQAEALIEILTPMLNNYVHAIEYEKENYPVLVRLAA